MNKPYKPIACALHSEYEVAIMHKKQLSIKWLDEHNEIHRAVILPKDILVKNGEEFLIAEAQEGSLLRIRLDHISLQE
jgi:transcriptional antiterminator Rof (Rho-off)